MAFYDILSPSGDTNLVGAALTQFFGMATQALHAFAGVEIVGSDAVAVRCVHPLPLPLPLTVTRPLPLTVTLPLP